MTKIAFPFYFLCLFLFLSPSFVALSADVPHEIEFAGMRLRIHESARRKIGADIDALRKSDHYFQMKVDRILMYFPIIEKVFEEEGLPEDFKYLAIQESSLISDAVSSSNAVGYWQFKKESALEVGMVVNNEVDDRKHIIHSTRGAARYLKRNNYFLRNWVYTLLSYNMGLGGTQRSVDKRYIGAETMEINGRTHWYVLKFLAHYLAFQDIGGPVARPSLTLLSYADCKGKTLSAIARELDVPEDDVKLYNKWLSRNRIPEDRDYVVIIPAPADQLEILMAKLDVEPATGLPQKSPEEEYVAVKEEKYERDTRFPILKKRRTPGSASTKKAVFYTINGKPGIQAQPGDNSVKLANQANISLERFLQYNDLKRNEPLVPGEVYYLRKKRSKAKVHEHIAVEGETLWQISQKYGITMKALMRKNRMKNPDRLQHGRVIWLRFIRPAGQPAEIRNIPKPSYAVKSKPDEKTAPITTPEAATKPETVIKKEPIAKAEPVTKTEVPAKTDEIVKAEPQNKLKPVAEKETASAPREEEVPEASSAPAKVESNPRPAIETPAAAQENNPVQQPEAKEVSSVPVQPVLPNQFKLHEVTTGQTLFSIARMYNVSVADLRKWNNLQETDGIKIGQVLTIAQDAPAPVTPAPAESQNTESKEYTVQTGDTLYKIAREHNTTVQKLMELNGKTDPKVSIGEKLKVK